ncbi:MAG: hypothetical protein AMXMBFR26_25080 [Porticoccaceae bacterium]
MRGIDESAPGRSFTRSTFERIPKTPIFVMHTPEHWLPSLPERWAIAITAYGFGCSDDLEQLCREQQIPKGLGTTFAEIVSGKRRPSGKRGAKTNVKMSGWHRAMLIACESRRAIFAREGGGYVMALRRQKTDPGAMDEHWRLRREQREAAARALGIATETLRNLVNRFDQLVRMAAE